MAFSPLETPEDLLQKLQRDFDRMHAAPDDFDAAFNFFVTAEHMLDWVLPGRSNTRPRTEARDAEILLQVTSHLANGLKHFRAEDRRHTSVRHIDVPPGAFDSRAFNADAFHAARVMVTLEGDAARRFGPEIDALALARLVLEYWRQRLGMGQSHRPAD